MLARYGYVKSFVPRPATSKNPTLFMFHSFNHNATRHMETCAQRCTSKGLDVHLVWVLDPTQEHLKDLVARLGVQMDFFGLAGFF